MTHIAVIGAGVIGAAVARQLAGRGARVTLYEARSPGAGTSTTTFAWVNANNKSPRSYHDLNVAGMAEHVELAAAPRRGEPWWFPTGRLEWAGTAEHDADLTARTDRLAGLGYPVRWLSPPQATDLEPDLRLPSTVERVAHFPAEGHVLPAVLLAHLLGGAREAGAALRAGTRVVTVAPMSTGVHLRLADGSTEIVDAAVTCAGRWTTPLLATAGINVPLADPDRAGSAAVGFLAWTAPLVARLARVVITSEITMRPDGGGRLVLQHVPEDTAADPAAPPPPDGPLAARLRTGLSRVLTGAGDAAITDVRVGQRALPVDGRTVCGPADPGSRLYTIATHSGITLAPLLARLAATEILTGTPDERLTPFRPDRFTAVPPGTAPTAARRPGDQ